MIAKCLSVWEAQVVAQATHDAAAIVGGVTVKQTGEPDSGHHHRYGAVGSEDRSRNRAHAECEALLVEGPATLTDESEFVAERADIGEAFRGVRVQSVAQRLVDASGFVEGQKCTAERRALDRQRRSDVDGNGHAGPTFDLVDYHDSTDVEPAVEDDRNVEGVRQARHRSLRRGNLVMGTRRRGA